MSPHNCSHSVPLHPVLDLAAIVMVLAASEGSGQAGAAQPQAQKRARVTVELAKFERADAAKAGEQATVVGGTRGSGDRFPLPLGPNDGMAFSTTPVFAWTYRRPTRKFLFTLYDSDGSEVPRDTVNGYEYRYPRNTRWNRGSSTRLASAGRRFPGPFLKSARAAGQRYPGRSPRRRPPAEGTGAPRPLQRRGYNGLT